MPELSRPSALQEPNVWARAAAFLERNRATLGLLLVLALTAWLALFWFQTVHRMISYYTPLPVWDYWRTAASVHAYQNFDFRVLWRQHNEHRIVFPEIVFAADYLLFHGLQKLPLTISFLCYAGSWLVLAWTFGSETTLPGLVRAAGILLAGIIIGWQGSAVVLADTFLLQWTLLQFAVLLALVFVARLKETGRTADLAAVIICSVVATYSSANGLMLWPVVLGAALALRFRKRHLAALAIAAALSIGIYFIGYQFTGTLSIANLFKHPWYLLQFVGAYLSMPFGAIKSTQFGVTVGLISLGLAVIFAVVAVRNRLSTSRLGVLLFGWYLFMLLTALLTAAGRMDLNDRVFSAAKAPRYLTGPLVTWAVFILLALWLAARLAPRFAPPCAIGFVIAVLMLTGLPKLRWWLHGSEQEHAKEQLETLAIDSGIYDANVELGVFPDPPAVDFWAKNIRETRSSVFYKSRTKWLGHPVRTFAPLRESFIPGEITYAFPVLDGVEVAGWLDDSELRGGRGWLLFANETGQIVGFGRKLPAGFPDMFDNPRTPHALGWVGFVNLSYSTKHFTAYAIGKRELIPIQGFAAVPDWQVTTLQRAGAQIRGIEWRMDPSWTINVLPRNPFLGQGPARPIYGSWSGADRNTGRITSSIFAAPENGCLVLPVLQGPREQGLSAEIQDADTGQTIASVPLQNAPRQWTFWRMSVSASSRHLRIVAEDEGNGWGEWLAIGNPYLCK